MKGWEVVKALSEGKRITTVNGVMRAKYIYLKDNTTLVAVAEDGETVREREEIPVQYLFVGEDWRVYDERIEKRSDYYEIINEVREKNKEA